MTTTQKLQRLRLWFVVYYGVNLILGTLASGLVVFALRSSSLPEMRALEDVSGGLVVAWSLVVGAVIFVVGLALFYQLLRRKNWARITMLVIAWLTAVSAGFSIISSCAMFSPSGWLLRMIPAAHWGIIGLLTLTSNATSLAYSIYMIRTLQSDQLVRGEFITQEQLAGGGSPR